MNTKGFPRSGMHDNRRVRVEGRTEGGMLMVLRWDGATVAVSPNEVTFIGPPVERSRPRVSNAGVSPSTRETIGVRAAQDVCVQLQLW